MKQVVLNGFAMLLCGVAFVACSHNDASFDEGYKAKSEALQRETKYEDSFVKAFGSIAPGHQWGFDQTTGHSLTRQAVTSTNEYWVIPRNCWGGSQNKEGWNANEIRAMVIKDTEGNMLPTLSDFSFDNYFLQQVEKVNGQGGGKVKKGIKWLEAFNSKTGKWEHVTNFDGGDNPDGEFVITAENTYFYAPKNKSAHGATLMADMGGAADPANGKLFRLLNSDDSYNYNYGFIRANAYHKDLKETINNEPFLVFEIPGKNEGQYLYWVIRLGVGEKITEPNDPIFAEGRVLCEDMGANDFDFNDVVFDATIMKTGEIKIKVLAHGGVLPIAVAGVEVTLGQMTNTGVNNADIQEFTIDAVNGKPKYASIAAIPVTVLPDSEAGNSYDLEANVGSAPQKICAPIGTRWPKEYTKISDAYSPFGNWVNNATPADWTNAMKSELVY